MAALDQGSSCLSLYFKILGVDECKQLLLS